MAMFDETTYRGQYEHYKEVHQRLFYTPARLAKKELKKHRLALIAKSRLKRRDPPRPAPAPAIITLTRILHLTAAAFDLRPSDILGRDRHGVIVRARHVVMYLARHMLHWPARSYPNIGRFTGGRDHSSCLNAERRIRELLPQDEELAFTVAHIERKLRGRNMSEAKVTFNHDHKYDLQLSQGLINERRLADIFTSKNISRIELKSETWQWEQTGNICIEFKHRDGRPSGIAATEADYWVHELKRDGETLVYLMFPKERLLELARQAYREGRHRRGGDGGEFEMVIIPLKDILR